MKILLLADLHANVLALEYILSETKNKYDLMVNLGDSIGIGPYPVETLQLLNEQKNLLMIMGNHEEELVNGVKYPRPSYMTKAEEEHHLWISNIMPESIKKWTKSFKKEVILEIENKRLRFLHSRYINGNYSLIPTDRNQYENYFSSCDENAICFGHSHKPECFGVTPVFINPGSAGCGMDGTGTYAIIEITDDNITYTLQYSKYSLKKDLCDLEERKVPARNEIMSFYMRSAF